MVDAFPIFCFAYLSVRCGEAAAKHQRKIMVVMIVLKVVTIELVVVRGMAYIAGDYMVCVLN